MYSPERSAGDGCNRSARGNHGSNTVDHKKDKHKNFAKRPCTNLQDEDNMENSPPPTPPPPKKNKKKQKNKQTL